MAAFPTRGRVFRDAACAILDRTASARLPAFRKPTMTNMRGRGSADAMSRRRRRLAGWLRWPLKTALFLAVLLFTLYPDPSLLARNVRHLANMSRMLDPANEGLAPLEAQVRERLGDARHGAHETLAAVEKVVTRRLPYDWDWNTWGVADYMPTVSEALEMGREDCDGRAVVAASLLKRMGHEAWLVSDVRHVWVATKEGETMSPGRAGKGLVATPSGTRVTVTPSTAWNALSGLAYGVAAFPLVRELILLAALTLLSMQPRSAWLRRWAGMVTMLAGLLLVRLYGTTTGEWSREALLSMVAGFAMLPVGWLILLTGAKRDAAARGARLESAGEEALAP